MEEYNINSQKYDLAQGFTIFDDFAYGAATHPANVHDALLIKCVGRSDVWFPKLATPYHQLDEYIQLINEKNLEKAVVILDDISFLRKCNTLKHLRIFPSFQAGDRFDFSPLYDLPEVKSLDCQTRYGDREQYCGIIDYSKIKGLIDLHVTVTKGTKEYNKVETLKSLSISSFTDERRDISHLFCSEQIDTLSMVQCGIKSLQGIDISKKMQCVYLHYNRSLENISALRGVKDTLRTLYLENCPKVIDFSVLCELENMECLELVGKNSLPDLKFIDSMPRLKTLTLGMKVLDGDLSACDRLHYVYLLNNYKHYNRKNSQLPKKDFSKLVRGNEDIEQWRRKY